MFGRSNVLALHRAILDGRLHQVRLLLCYQNNRINSRDSRGNTPLMLACVLENEDIAWRIIKLLLLNGANLDIKDNCGRTALSGACILGKEKIVGKLLQEDALDLNSADNDGYTAIHHAAESNNPKLVRAICTSVARFGYDIDVRNNLGYTPLLLSCKAGHFASANIILTVGKASCNIRDNEFFLNAKEWVLRRSSFKLCHDDGKLGLAVDRRSYSCRPRIEKSTKYLFPASGSCYHTKSQLLNFVRSNTEFFRKSCSRSESQGSRIIERDFSEKQAQIELLESINKSIDNYSTNTDYYDSKGRPVKSAKLRAIIKSKAPLKLLDTKSIFKAYSFYTYDQSKIGGNTSDNHSRTGVFQSELGNTESSNQKGDNWKSTILPAIVQQ